MHRDFIVQSTDKKGILNFYYKDIIDFSLVEIPLFISYLIPELSFEKYRTIKNIRFKQDDFKLSFLSDKELEYMNQFKSLKKQVEWICGRFAVKKLIGRFKENKEKKSIELSKLKILKKEEGAPYSPELLNQPISISHSHNYALAALCLKKNYRLGVDIEKIRKVDKRALIKFAFSEREIKLLKEAKDKTFILRWSMKEALLKLIEKGFHQSLKSVEILGDKVFIEGREERDIVCISADSRKFGFNKDFAFSLAYQKL